MEVADMRSKLPAFVFMLCLTMALALLSASPALAAEGEGTGVTTYDNGLVVAVLGIIVLYGFLFGMVFNILRKRKKKLKRPE
jgi:hypothetical protein